MGATVDVWEYIDVVSHRERDELGRDGWEAYAATVQTREECDDRARVVERVQEVHFHMKRPLSLVAIVNESKGKAAKKHGGDHDCG